MKAVFLFPGQGAQYVGMGRELHDHFPAAKAVFDRAAARLGGEYVDVAFQGPEDKLRQTRFTQPALFIVSMAALEVVKEAGWAPVACAGHSLGEYSALCAAGAFSLETGLDLVKARGEAIQSAAEAVPGAMAAVVGLERPVVEDVCRRASAKGVCQAVNFNCPGQVVIAGESAAVDEAVRLAGEAGSPKSVRLNVSGAFHSSLMKPAADKMAAVLAGAQVQDPRVPVYMNVDAAPAANAADVRLKLARQVDHPVLWEDAMRLLLPQADVFMELGAGRVLSGLLRRIDKARKALNVEDKKSADALPVREARV